MIWTKDKLIKFFFFVNSSRSMKIRIPHLLIIFGFISFPVLLPYSFPEWLVIVSLLAVLYLTSYLVVNRIEE